VVHILVIVLQESFVLKQVRFAGEEKVVFLVEELELADTQERLYI
jgi:hypothetical protein